MKKTIALAATACVLIFTSCSKSSDKTETADATEAHVHDHDAAESADVAASEETSTEENVASADNTVLEITVKAGDDMKFDLTTIKATAGQKVKLTLVHSGKLPKASMGHNLVILKNGVDAADFSTKAIAAKDNDYIPAGSEGDIIAKTALIGGGETSTIEFTAPARGAYDYICTFPGHSAIMKGKLMVK